MTRGDQPATSMTIRQHMSLEIYKTLISRSDEYATADNADYAVFLTDSLLDSLHTPPELRGLEDE